MCTAHSTYIWGACIWWTITETDVSKPEVFQTFLRSAFTLSDLRSFTSLYPPHVWNMSDATYSSVLLSFIRRLFSETKKHWKRSHCKINLRKIEGLRIYMQLLPFHSCKNSKSFGSFSIHGSIFFTPNRSNFVSLVTLLAWWLCERSKNVTENFRFITRFRKTNTYFLPRSIFAWSLPRLAGYIVLHGNVLEVRSQCSSKPFPRLYKPFRTESKRAVIEHFSKPKTPERFKISSVYTASILLMTHYDQHLVKSFLNFFADFGTS